jgi:hypothetical protein
MQFKNMETLVNEKSIIPKTIAERAWLPTAFASRNKRSWRIETLLKRHKSGQLDWKIEVKRDLTREKHSLDKCSVTKIPTRLDLDDSLTERFTVLASEWEKATRYKSLMSDIVFHPAYQQIIGMGSPVVPLLLKELKNNPAHWFWALRSITGVNPVKPEHKGRLHKMAQDWLQWGKDRGYEF